MSFIVAKIVKKLKIMCIFLKEKQGKSAQWFEKVRYLWIV